MNALLANTWAMHGFYFLIGLGVGICLGFIVTSYLLEKWWFK